MKDLVDAETTKADSGDDENPVERAAKKRKVVTSGGEPAAEPVTAKDAAKKKTAWEIERDWEEEHKRKIVDLRNTDHEFPSKQHLYTYNVGQGDSALYVNIEKKLAILIDAGTAKRDQVKKVGLTAEQITTTIEPGEESITKEAIGSDIEKLPAAITKLWVVVTHADSDHWNWLSGLAKVIKEKKPKIMVTCLAHSKGGDSYNNFLKTVKTTYGWEHTPGTAHLPVTIVTWEKATSTNNMSHVSLIPLDESTAYLNMGDAEEGAEKALEKDIDGMLGIDNTTGEKGQYSTLIVKAGHHGSETSSSDALLNVIRDHVAPRGDLIVLFSVAKHPSTTKGKVKVAFKHPHSSTTKKWEELGKANDFRVTIYRTHETRVITTSCTSGLVQVIPKNTAGVGKVKDFHILECARDKKNAGLVELEDKRIWVQEAATTGNALYEAVTIALGKPASHVQELREKSGEWCSAHMPDNVIGAFTNYKENPNWTQPTKEQAGAWFKTDGNWDGELGDLAPWVLANAIEREIVIVAEKATYRFVPAISNPPAITIFYANKTYTAKPRESHKDYESRGDWPDTPEPRVKRSPTDVGDQAKKNAMAKKPAS